MYEIKLWDEEKNIYILTDAAGVLRDQNPDNLQLPRSCQQYALFPSRKTAQEMADRLNRESEQAEATKMKEESARSQEYLERLSLETAAIIGTLERKRALEAGTAAIKTLSSELYVAEGERYQAVKNLEIAQARVLELEITRDTAKLRIDVLKSKLADEQSRLEKSKGAKQ